MVGALSPVWLCPGTITAAAGGSVISVALVPLMFVTACPWAALCQVEHTAVSLRSVVLSLVVVGPCRSGLFLCVQSPVRPFRSTSSSVLSAMREGMSTHLFDQILSLIRSSVVPPIGKEWHGNSAYQSNNYLVSNSAGRSLDYKADTELVGLRCAVQHILGQML